VRATVNFVVSPLSTDCVSIQLRTDLRSSLAYFSDVSLEEMSCSRL
jgi:hypothetical protein